MHRSLKTVDGSLSLRFPTAPFISVRGALPLPVPQKYLPQLKHERAPPFAGWAKGGREAVTGPIPSAAVM